MKAVEDRIDRYFTGLEQGKPTSKAYSQEQVDEIIEQYENELRDKVDLTIEALKEAETHAYERGWEEGRNSI